MVDQHHGTFTVVDVEQCYDGKYTVCEIDVERDRDGALKSVEVDYIVSEGQKLYMDCYYRGVEKNTRFCYTNLKPKYDRKKHIIINCNGRIMLVYLMYKLS